MYKVIGTIAIASLLVAAAVSGQTGYLVPGVGTLGNWDTYLLFGPSARWATQPDSPGVANWVRTRSTTHSPRGVR